MFEYNIEFKRGGDVVFVAMYNAPSKGARKRLYQNVKFHR